MYQKKPKTTKVPITGTNNNRQRRSATTSPLLSNLPVTPTNSNPPGYRSVNPTQQQLMSTNKQSSNQALLSQLLLSHLQNQQMQDPNAQQQLQGGGGQTQAPINPMVSERNAGINPNATPQPLMSQGGGMPLTQADYQAGYGPSSINAQNMANLQSRKDVDLKNTLLSTLLDTQREHGSSTAQNLQDSATRQILYNAFPYLDPTSKQYLDNQKQINTIGGLSDPSNKVTDSSGNDVLSSLGYRQDQQSSSGPSIQDQRAKGVNTWIGDQQSMSMAGNSPAANAAKVQMAKNNVKEDDLTQGFSGLGKVINPKLLATSADRDRTATKKDLAVNQTMNDQIDKAINYVKQNGVPGETDFEKSDLAKQQAGILQSINTSGFMDKSSKDAVKNTFPVMQGYSQMVRVGPDGVIQQLQALKDFSSTAMRNRAASIGLLPQSDVNTHYDPDYVDPNNPQQTQQSPQSGDNTQQSSTQPTQSGMKTIKAQNSQGQTGTITYDPTDPHAQDMLKNYTIMNDNSQSQPTPDRTVNQTQAGIPQTSQSPQLSDMLGLLGGQ